VQHIHEPDRDELIVEIMSTEAVTTSQIEGEILDRASVQSSVRRQMGLSSDRRRAKPAETGVAEMTVDVYRSFAEPLAERMLTRWHSMLMQGREALQRGKYRTSEEPMQVVSGPLHAPKVHFEAPPSCRIPAEMAQFIEWFNRTAPTHADPLPALTRAGIAHLYFESIHPYDDGNGRIGRAISEKALAQSLDRPPLTALAATIAMRRKSYYAALERASQQNEITEWLVWFATIALEAQCRTRAQVEFLIDKARFLDALRGELNERQEKALLRMLREGPNGFQGGLSASNYMSITGASPATATRDLAGLVERKALLRTGERRHARYHVNIPLRPVPRITIAGDGEVEMSSR
jgi:Fic family protein